MGCETAIFLAQAGKDVIVVEALEDILLEEYNDLNRAGLVRKLRESEVKTLTGCLVDEITREGVFLRENKETRRFLEADSVVISTGLMSQRELHDKLKYKFAEVYSVGDCVEPRKIFDAVHEAALIAHGI